MSTEQQEREAMLIETLQSIMAVVCGNRCPRWDTDEHVYASREAISNACEAALSAQPVAESESYAAANPLGGPAKVFDAIADHIRAGDSVEFAMRLFGVAWAQPVAQQAPELDPLTLCECGDQFTKECPGTCVNCLAAMPKVRDEQDAKDAALEAERDRLCAAIKAEDDHCATGDYMLDSDDCIKVIRGTWVRPDYTVTAKGGSHD